MNVYQCNKTVTQSFFFFLNKSMIKFLICNIKQALQHLRNFDINHYRKYKYLKECMSSSST